MLPDARGVRRDAENAPKNTEGGGVLTNPQLSTYVQVGLRYVDLMVLAMQAENADGNESFPPGGGRRRLGI